jgi:hypothetical protein
MSYPSPRLGASSMPTPRSTASGWTKSSEEPGRGSRARWAYGPGEKAVAFERPQPVAEPMMRVLALNDEVSLTAAGSAR